MIYFTCTIRVLQIQIDFHMKGRAPGLVLKQKQKVTRKWLQYCCGFYNVSNPSRPFAYESLVTWPMTDSEAGGDLALIQTSLLLSCECQLVSITKTYTTKTVKSLSNQGQLQPEHTTTTTTTSPVTEHTTVKWSVVQTTKFKFLLTTTTTICFHLKIMTTIKSDLPVKLMLLILQHVIDFMLRNFLQRFKDLSQFIGHDITSAITIKNTKCLLRFFLVEGELILCHHQLNEFFKVHLSITLTKKIVTSFLLKLP